jgi:hypothetical protein
MRFSEPPPVERAGKGPGDELDTLLRAFFQSKLPHPWPAPALPAAEEQGRPVVPLTPAAAHPWVPVRSRLALAASVGLLLAGSWFLAEQFQAGPGDPPTADWHHPHAAKKDLDGPPKVIEFLEQGEDGTTKLRLNLWDRR